MKLYHGSNVIIEEIDPSKSLPNKDFGQAFYLSENREQAFQMATLKTSLLGGSPIVTEFEYVADKNAKLLSFEGYTKDWADFIFANRDAKNNFSHGYDIVYGPIANDRVGIQIINLREGVIGIDEFIRRLQFIKGITFQYAFCTPFSLTLLKRVP